MKELIKALKRIAGGCASVVSDGARQTGMDEMDNLPIRTPEPPKRLSENAKGRNGNGN